MWRENVGETDMKPEVSNGISQMYTDRIEIDITPVDLLMVDVEDRAKIKRPSMLAAFDKYSGCLVGLNIAFSPNKVHFGDKVIMSADMPE